MGELEILSLTIRVENRLLQEQANLRLSNFRIREAGALGVIRSSQMHPRDLAVWRARIQSRMNELSSTRMRINRMQATVMLGLCTRDQILVNTERSLEAIIFLKKHSDWNGSARVPFMPRGRQLQLVPELERNGIPIIQYMPPVFLNI